jgi:DNA-binding response OmpR family regulator
MPSHAPPPRILLVMPAQWPRALLRAALREVGYDATGTRALRAALYQAAPDSERGPVRLVVLDQDALAEDEGSDLEALRSRTSAAPIVLLAPATRRVREGPWARVIRRPTSIATLVRQVESLMPLAAQARHPID